MQVVLYYPIFLKNLSDSTVASVKLNQRPPGSQKRIHSGQALPGREPLPPKPSSRPSSSPAQPEEGDTQK